ncbi:MAG: enoyl-CoA hydratase [Candidatus Schekmanbacteria bacterium]|nr:MAG: enoyl-CoA hydratase [Candidatus Schekmanbacteria bacterium]
MAFKNILFEIDDSTAIVTINRPKFLNVINSKTATELTLIFEEIKESKTIKSIIIKGAGKKAFSAGADINEIKRLTKKTARSFLSHGHKMLKCIEFCGKPVIAAISGYVLGGGLELALACHFRIATKKSKFGLPELKIGVIPGWGGNVRLPRIVGRAKALEMILTGKILNSDEALEAGLINEVVAENEFMVKVRERASRLNEMPPLAIKKAIDTIMKATEISFQEAIKLEMKNMSSLCETYDKKEGIAAFLEKRETNFKGR